MLELKLLIKDACKEGQEGINWNWDLSSFKLENWDGLLGTGIYECKGKLGVDKPVNKGNFFIFLVETGIFE